jgi:hypothetical protein
VYTAFLASVCPYIVADLQQPFTDIEDLQECLDTSYSEGGGDTHTYSLRTGNIYSSSSLS